MTAIPDRPAVDVIVCVHNSFESVELCLSSVVGSISEADRLIIVDDGSEDETRILCEGFARDQKRPVMLIRRPEGSGFCQAANAGLGASTADYVVLLNSDTIVFSGWLDKFHACFSANPWIGVVGPLSNAGGWQSIPSLGSGGPPNNDLVHDLSTLHEVQEYCASFRERYDYPIVEQINGFCFAVRRGVLSDVGFLDEENFPRGYGEEADFGFRAQDHGYLCCVAIDCFVYHAKTKSYTVDQRSSLIKAGRIQVDRKHGVERVKAAMRNTKLNPILVAIREEADAVFRERHWLSGDT